MKWLAVKIIFKHNEPELAVDLISQLFYGLEATGVVIEDPSLKPDQGRADDAATCWEHHAVTAYFPENHLSSALRQILERGLGDLEKMHHIQSRIVFCHLDEEDWSESWKAHFHPEKVGKRLVVKPSWHAYEAQRDEIVVEIDPGMAFGTGTHPTTRLCLNMIEAYMKPGNSLLDVGTGSGILMIAAVKLGAKKVCGIDKDSYALDVAKKNLMRNMIDSKKYMLLCGNLVEPIVKRFDLVVANLWAEAVIDLLAYVPNMLKANGCFLCSGIIKQHHHKVDHQLKALDFEILNIYSEKEWVAIVGKLR